MPNRLGAAMSPYLRSHADNPVDWFPWGEEAFAEARRRDIPVFISIGYSTCHWCHVMARESFSDPELARYLNANFVSIKVDREEHPDVDSSYLAAASAFTDQLGWPLSVFATPDGKAFFAGTYFPPTSAQGRASFRQVLDAVLDAWANRRDAVVEDAGRLASTLAAQAARQPGTAPGPAQFDRVVAELAQYEDAANGGFGGAPKFPVAPVLGFLLDREAAAGDEADNESAQTAGALARRTLAAMAGSELRDPVDGGFFRYATRRDWSEPHYERMLYDNALLLSEYARSGDEDTARGIAGFLLDVMQLPGGGFASAQDSESTVDGVRVEGGYYALDREARAKQTPPALDDKILTGWNGLAIDALAYAGTRYNEPRWIDAARRAAAVVDSEPLLRARVDGTASTARATLEDYGMLAGALLELALATGVAAYAVRARDLVEATMRAAGLAAPDAERAPAPFRVPGGGDPVLAANGMALESDPSEGAYPSGLSALARAALRLYELGADSKFRDAAGRAVELVAPLAIERPMSFGATLGVASALASAPRQLLVVTPDRPVTPDRDDALASLARSWHRPDRIVTVVTPAQRDDFVAAGFTLFEERELRDNAATAYLCEGFVCRLPLTDADELAATLP